MMLHNLRLTNEAHASRYNLTVLGIRSGTILEALQCSERRRPSFLITLIGLGGIGAINAQNMRLFAIGLPALALGTWAGWKLYGRLDDRKFRITVLVLLLLSGISLVMMV